MTTNEALRIRNAGVSPRLALDGTPNTPYNLFIATETPTMTTTTITIAFSESNVLRNGRTFESFAGASASLQSACYHAPEGGAYHKTQVVIELDGETYTARLDLTTDTVSGNLLAHVRHVCEYMKSERGLKWVKEAARADRVAESEKWLARFAVAS